MFKFKAFHLFSYYMDSFKYFSKNVSKLKVMLFPNPKYKF